MILESERLQLRQMYGFGLWDLGMAVIKEFVKPYQIGDMHLYLYGVEK
ncbi:hypothetical protein [Paenibacillus sp. KS1]|nr:hypothetical protein [Paenibacillus sp. KS1]